MRLAVHHLELDGARPVFGEDVKLAGAAGVDLGGERLILIAAPNLYLSYTSGTHRAATPRPVHAPGLAHLCLQSRDGDRLRGALAAAGVGFLSAPTALGTGFRYSYAHDPAGRLMEVESAPFLPTTPAAWFGHFALVSPDAARLAGFYGALLGTEPASGGRFRDNARIDTVAGLSGVDVSVWWVRAPDFTLEFWEYRAPGYAGPAVDGGYRAVGLETDDLDQAVALVVAHGASAEAWSEGADGRAALLRDPDGNRLRLVQLSRPDLSVDALPHRDVLARAAAARRDAA